MSDVAVYDYAINYAVTNVSRPLFLSLSFYLPTYSSNLTHPIDLIYLYLCIYISFIPDT